ncbi:MAG TPA: hypothetical protein VHW03_05380 [Chthoniobacterales bacterium]|jgi:hypothetical protein|nr:hypothetical protein [Chthoniobacterales bacterium]
MSALPNESESLTNFEHDLPDWDFFSIGWLATRLRVSATHVEGLVETGEIKCALDIRGNASCRRTLRVPRKAVIAFFNKRRDLETVAASNPRPKYRSEAKECPSQPNESKNSGSRKRKARALK